MDWLERMNGALRYIEDNLDGKTDYREVARRACCSEYHFKRMFSFIAGVTLSEYIRRRRLSQAAFDLKNSNLKVIDIAVKYGYNSPDAFARAFQSLHGVTPTEARQNVHSLKAYPCLTFQITIKGGIEMNYRVEQKGAFRVVGIKNRVKADNNQQVNPEITAIWETLGEKLQNQIEGLSDLEPSGMLNVCANFSEDTDGNADEGELDYYIAAATTKPCPNNLAQLNIPALTWAVFEVEGPWEAVQDAWVRVYTEWFPASGYEHAEGPEILASVHERSEIWIPVVKK